jgi:hypothetical protein
LKSADWQVSNLSFVEITKGVYNSFIGSTIQKCVTCDKPLEFRLIHDEYLCSHHCPTNVEAGALGARRREYDSPESRSEGKRLWEGMKMIELSENPDLDYIGADL